MKKSQSLAWQAAKAYAKRKYTYSVPIALSEDGLTVTMESLIRDNTWKYKADDFRLLLMRRLRSGKVINHPLFCEVQP
jgi:replication-associated recombination protein RarA